jgi:hypothetical protein
MFSYRHSELSLRGDDFIKSANRNCKVVVFAQNLSRTYARRSLVKKAFDSLNQLQAPAHPFTVPDDDSPFQDLASAAPAPLTREILDAYLDESWRATAGIAQLVDSFPVRVVK